MGCPYEVWQAGVEARLSRHRLLRCALQALDRVRARFRKSPNYNAGSLIAFEVRRVDGKSFSKHDVRVMHKHAFERLKR